MGDELAGLGFVVVGASSTSVQSIDDEPVGGVTIGSLPVASDKGGHEVLIIFSSPSGFVDASAARASAKRGGNSRPRFFALRKMPAAALGLKKNLDGTTANSTSANDEYTPPALGHSEVTAVQHSPGEVVKPEVPQRTENDGEISSTVGTEQAGDVLNEHPASRSHKLPCNPGELEEQAGPVASESSASSGDGEVLAREPATENINGGSRSLPAFNGGCRSSLAA